MFLCSENIWCVCWADNDIVTGSLDGTLKIWNRQQLSLKSTSKSQRFGVTSIASTSDGSITVSSYQNGEIRFFQTNTLDEIGCISAGLLESWTVCLSPNDDVLASGTHAGGVNIWSMQESHEKVATLQTNNKFILASVFNVDAKLACAGIDGYVNIFDVSTQKIMHTINAHSLATRSIVFSPDGKLVYTGSDDRHISVYDTNSGTIINSFSHRGMVFSVDTAPDGRTFAAGCADHSVYLWDLGMQKRIQSFEQHTNQVWDVSFNPNSPIDKLVLASVGDDALLQLYE